MNEYFVTGDFKFREQLDQNDPDQFQGSMSMDEEPDFTTAMQTSQTINSFMPIHNHNSRNQVYQQHNQDTPMTSRRDILTSMKTILHRHQFHFQLKLPKQQ